MAKTTTENPARVKKIKVSTSKDAAAVSETAHPVTAAEPKAKTAKSKATTSKQPATAVPKKRKAGAEDTLPEPPSLEVDSGSKGKKSRTKAAVEMNDNEAEEVVSVKEAVKEKKGKRAVELESTGSTSKAKKPTTKKQPVQKEKSESEPEPEDAAEQEEDQEEVQFFGFATDDDEDDSSDEELDIEPEALDVAKLPTIAKDDAIVKKKLEKAKRKPTADRGVLYLGRVPHGFYEDQMKSYFSQFGDVTRLRLSRNKKTGRPKHYAFIEFESSSVAQIVADTMDNYLLMGHILTCKVIPKDKVHPELWVGANRKWRAIPNERIARLQHNKSRTEEERAKAEERLIKRQDLKKRKLAESGISYNFDAVAYKRSKPAKS